MSKIPDNVKVFRDDDLMQEAEIRLTVSNIGEVKNAIAVLNKVRAQAFDELNVDTDEPEDGETVVTSIEYRVEGETVVAHVTQGLVE